MPEFGTCIILTVITVVINALTTPGNASTTRILSMSTAYFSRCSGGPPSTGLGGGVRNSRCLSFSPPRLQAAPSWPRASVSPSEPEFYDF